MKTKKEKAPKPDLYTDLRGITRDTKQCSTTVTIELDWNTKVKWLEFGQSQIRSQRDRQDGRWRLEARMTNGVTDFEHDSAYALRLPLIGLQLGDMAVHYHTTYFTAWVDPNEDDDFHVPRNGYDPTKLKDSHLCKMKECLGEHPEGHIIVPEGYFVPPIDKELYNIVRGKRVEITVGPV